MTRDPRSALGCAFAALVLLAGCAGGREDDAPDVRRFGGSGADGAGRFEGRRALNVFLSPSGEPFHGGRDDPYVAALWFARADADHDGRLTPAEFRADALRFFRTLDTDGNGEIDGFELQAYEQKIAPEIQPRIGGLRGGEGADETLFQERGGRGGRGGGGRRGGSGGGGAARPARQIAGDRRPEGASLFGVLDEPEPVTAADADLNGRVTLAEWTARSDRRFALLDEAGRGYLTLDGLPKTQAQLILERLRRREAEARARAGPTSKR